MPSNDPLTRKTQVSKLLKRPDPLLSFKWICPDETLPFGLPSDYLESIDLSWRNVKVESGVYVGGGYDYYPGSHDISGFTMVLYEDQECNTMKWVDYWKKQIKDMSTGLYQLPTKYKKDMKIELMNSKNQAVMTVELIGIWPEATSNWSLNYTDNGRLTVSQAFSIDDQLITFP